MARTPGGQRTHGGSDGPQVVLLGDSICQGYTPHVRDLLRGARLRVTRLPAGSSSALLADAQIWQALKSARLVHVNVGLHDLKFDCRLRTHAVGLEAYRKHVREILDRLRGAGRTVIWATTTPVVDARRGVSGSPQNADFIRRNDDVRAFNTAAIDIARELGVERNDLYMAIVGGGAQRMIGPDGVHLVDAGYQVCAGHVAHTLERALRN